MIAGLKRRWLVFVVIALCALVIAQEQVSLAIKVLVVVLGMGAVTAWNVVRNLRLHATVNRLAALGQPDAMLAIVEAELSASTSPQVQVPFSIYKATALYLKGWWSESLRVLDQVEHASLSGQAGHTWRLLHSAQRLSCLVFLERPDEARQVFEQQVVPFATRVFSPATDIIVKEARAKLAFAEGRCDDSATLFQELLDDGRLVPASRAVHHYFLGRIALMRDQDPSDHFHQARELAGDTFILQTIDDLQKV